MILHQTNSKNLAHTLEDFKQVIATSDNCRQLKPKFYKPSQRGQFIKALKQFDRISIDLVDPKTPFLKSGNVYLITVMDKFSRLPFAFRVKDITAKTTIMCLSHLFDILWTQVLYTLIVEDN